MIFIPFWFYQSPVSLLPDFLSYWHFLLLKMTGLHDLNHWDIAHLFLLRGKRFKASLSIFIRRIVLKSYVSSEISPILINVFAFNLLLHIWVNILLLNHLFLPVFVPMIIVTWSKWILNPREGGYLWLESIDCYWLEDVNRVNINRFV